MSNQSNPPDPFNPTLRRIGPADLPKEATTAPADRTSKIPAGVSDSSPKPRPASCPRCQDSGYYTLPVAYGHPDFCKLQSCNCAAYQQQLAPRAARLGDELGSLADKTFDRFDLTRPIVPTVWQGAAMSEVAQRNFLRAAHKRCQAWSAAPRGWLFLHGAFGAGKSHLAAAIANDQMAQGKIVRFVTVNKLLDILRAAIDRGDTEALITDLIACDVLILDELAAAHLAECASDWRFGRIERLVNERLSKPTVVTSNLAIDDLALPGDLRAERVADRIADVSQIVWMPIASYRRIKKEAAS
jgi:DNA replication protein DnaC